VAISHPWSTGAPFERNYVGQSVKHVGWDLRSPVFTHGQFYVTVSRVTSVGNIKVILGEEDKTVVYKEVLLNLIGWSEVTRF
jgi:hypothetical protein